MDGSAHLKQSLARASYGGTPVIEAAQYGNAECLPPALAVKHCGGETLTVQFSNLAFRLVWLHCGQVQS